MVKMQRMPLREKYLGIPLFVGRNKNASFEDIVDKIAFRLQSWLGESVNQAGRSTQIQVVTGSMAEFQMSCMYIPDKIIKKLESLQRNYWWNKKLKQGGYFIGWKELNNPKRFGGLGFKSKCVQLLQAKYFKNTDPLYGKFKKNGTWIRNGIHIGLQWIRRYHIWEIVNGTKIII
ncbi:uncharacterized protein LOC113315933 [Papaver somniferum]|uniref:uncharacterized protein LOC113315933 n=1 Tax=Papaver somniferum TaxID=3469 RepID=UPI000E6FC44F|nr:uncharacterized protein LOC113315933 [Papaver somniferum]